MDTKHRIDTSQLNDYYGCMLTPHQTEMIRLYYDCDISLNEIAEQYGISRQAVRDALMRGEKTLADMESKLHLVERSEELVNGLSELLLVASSDEIKDKIEHLISIVEGE